MVTILQLKVAKRRLFEKVSLERCNNNNNNWGEGGKIPGSSIWNQKDSWGLESHSNTYRDWCSWKYIEKS